MEENSTWWIVRRDEHGLLSVMPEEIARRGFAMSPDDRRIYFSVSTTEADVWLAEFER